MVKVPWSPPIGDKGGQGVNGVNDTKEHSKNHGFADKEQTMDDEQRKDQKPCGRFSVARAVPYALPDTWHASIRVLFGAHGSYRGDVAAR